MMPRNIFVVILICTGLFVIDSMAAIRFSEPFRSVSAGNGSSDSISSAGFGLFDERAIAWWETSGDGVAAPAWAEEYECGDYFASAYQNSTITSSSIVGRGFTEEWNPFYHPGFKSYSQSAETILNANLVIDTPRWIVINATINAWGDYGGTEYGNYNTEIILSRQLESPDELEPIFSASMNGSDNYINGGWWESHRMDIDETIFLSPGTYTFLAKATSEASYSESTIPYYEVGGGGYAYFDIKSIPEPCTLMLLGLGGLALRLKQEPIDF